jgi:hypothetical protein
MSDFSPCHEDFRSRPPLGRGGATAGVSAMPGRVLGTRRAERPPGRSALRTRRAEHSHSVPQSGITRYSAPARESVTRLPKVFLTPQETTQRSNSFTDSHERRTVPPAGHPRSRTRTRVFVKHTARSLALSHAIDRNAMADAPTPPLGTRLNVRAYARSFVSRTTSGEAFTIDHSPLTCGDASGRYFIGRQDGILPALPGEQVPNVPIRAWEKNYVDQDADSGGA